MELWVRSQDKNLLIAVYGISLFQKTIFASNKECKEFILGTYSTEKRALEVLDEIQEVLCPKVLIMKSKSQITISDNVNFVLPDNCSYERIGDTYVYEMPEE